MKALQEIMYKMVDGQPVEDYREVVCPEHWKEAEDQLTGEQRIYIRTSLGWDEAKPLKFAAIPLEDARCISALSKQARQLADRNANLHQALLGWVHGTWSLLEALRMACALCLQRIEAIRRSYGVEPNAAIAFDADESLGAWLGRAGQLALMDMEAMRMAGERALIGRRDLADAMTVAGEKLVTELSSKGDHE